MPKRKQIRKAGQNTDGGNLCSTDARTESGGQGVHSNPASIANGLALNPSLRIVSICALLVVLVFCVFGQTLRHEFVNYDDHAYVYKNPVVANGLTLHGIVWVFTHIDCHFYHPLTMLSLMLDYQMHGLQAAGYHLTNVLLHAASVVLLFLILRQMTGAFWRCAFVAALFAIHPLRVESVAWVSERKDLLCGVFFMATIGAYVRYARHPFSAANYLIVIAAFLAGLLSKTTIVTLPFLLILLDYWPLNRFQTTRPQRLILEKLPMLLLSAAASVVALYAQGKLIATTTHSSTLVCLENVVVSYATYLFQMFFPAGLAPFYPPVVPSSWQIILSSITVGTISALAIISRKKRPYIAIGWLWYLGMLVPMIGLVQIGDYTHADRFTYLPQVGLYLAGTWIVADWIGEKPRLRPVIGTMAVAALWVLAAAAFLQTSFWRDSFTLWTRALACTRDNYVAHNSLGLVLFNQGRMEDSISHFRETIRINPAYSKAYSNLGLSLLRQGRTEEAVANYQKAFRIDPADAEAHYNLGMAYVKMGRLEEAMDQYQKAIELNPGFAQAHFNLAAALLADGQLEKAVRHLENGLEYAPGDAQAHLLLGDALSRSGRTEEAVGHFRKALELKPDYPDASLNLGLALDKEGRFSEAMTQFSKVLEAVPDSVPALNNLAWLLATSASPSLRDGAKAVQLAESAQRLTNGADANILDTLAAAYAETGNFQNAVQTAQTALKIAEAGSQTTLAAELRREINIYGSGRRFEDVR